MKRVVISGMGLVSPLGNNKMETLESLRETRSGIKFQEEYKEMGLRSHVAGSIDIDIDGQIDRKLRRFMGDAAAFSYIALVEAIMDAGLEESEVSNVRTGIVAGSGGASSSNLIEASDILRTKGLKRIGPYRVTRTMSSTVSACLATAFKIKGVNYSITSACSTSAHCIGHAMELIQLGKQDIVLAGGGEEEHWSMTSLFDAMGALSTQRNDAPGTASRAYDKDRDGFVIAGGGGFLVVEELEHAKARGAKIYAELVGYGATSDGFDMVSPSGEGGQRAIEMALSTVNAKVDYINAHGTSTMADTIELGAVERLLGDYANDTLMSSTKSATGHLLGAAGAIEAIFSILAIRDQVAPPTINLDNLDAETTMNLCANSKVEANINIALSNSFGFGGTNACLLMGKIN